MAVLALAFAPGAIAGGFQVNDPGDGLTASPVCDPLAQTGTPSCTLRDAIALANANADADTIGFQIGAGGSQTITLTSPLPAITTSTVINGTTQLNAGFAGITLEGGNSAAVPGWGLDFHAASSELRGLTIHGFTVSSPTGAGAVRFGANNGRVGDGSAPDGNVLSGNATGLLLAKNTSGAIVEGNFIGVGADGVTHLPNTDGVLIDESVGNAIGVPGGVPNVISWNTSSDVTVGGQPAILATGNSVRNNLIGVDVNGNGAAGGGSVGVEVAFADNVLIRGNVISGHAGAGISIGIASPGAVIQANTIGLTTSGASFPNGGDGINLGSNGALIGGDPVTDENQIAHNGGRGISLLGGVGTTIKGNQIHDNASLGIDLGNDLLTANDPAPDADTGANNLQNFPVVSSASLGSGTLAASGTIDSTGSTDYLIEVFQNASCDASGNGEGGQFVASTTVTTDSVGAGSWSASGSTASIDSVVTATATNLSTGDTSEFSVCTFVAEAAQPGPTFTVNTNADHDDGTCSVSDCTLSEAINAANAQSGTNTINFNIAGPGVQTIQPTTPLPTVTDPVTIDGYSQPGSAANTSATVDNAVLHIELTGVPGGYGGCDCFAAGLEIAAPSTVRGLVVNGEFEAGIEVENAAAAGSHIVGNFVGTNPAGTASGGALFYGVYLSSASSVMVGGPTPAERNVISGNSSVSGGVGVELTSGSTNNTVQGNLIGTNAAGTGAVPNAIGIQVGLGGLNSTITGNVVSGNSGVGIWASDQTATTTVITLNRVGTDAAGTAALGNGGDGILFENSSGNTVGGPGAPYRNVISGNGGHGVEMRDASNNFVQGNYVGVNAAGTAAIANTIDGIAVDGGSGNLIGGVTADVGNLTSGNHNQGISIFQVNGLTAATGNIVRGNRAGLNAAGTGFIPNGGDGIRVFHGTNTIIGGIATGEANESAGNGANGVAIIGAASTGNSIRRNRIHDNGLLGIELTAGDNFDGLTPNDAGDVDSGANNLQNFPVLTTAIVNGASTRITGTLDTSPGTYTIDYYASAACDASGNGEGARWLGFSVLPTSAAGSLTIDTGTGITAPVSVGESITATATDPAGNTSEFSACVTAEGAPAGLSLTADEASVPAGAANVPLSSVPATTLGLFAGAPIPNSPIPNSAVGAAPIPNSPIANSPIPNSPIPNSPIANSPIANSGFDGIPRTLLANVLLSSIPIDWTAIFVAPDTHAGVPLTSLTLSDLFADTPALARFERLSLGQLQLQNSLLRGVRFTSFLFGATKLKYIPPYMQPAWCALLASCTGVDVNTTTVLGLDVAGLLNDATVAALGNVEVADITDPGPPVTPIPNSPIPNSPIPNSPIPNSPIPNSSLSLTAIGSIVIGDLYSPSAVVDCTKFASTNACLAGTLADAARLNAIKATATFQDLINAKNGVSPMAHVKFNEFAIGLIGLENLPWESWPFDGFQEFAGTGDVVHYHLTAPVPCNTAYTLRALLPRGFLVKRGTSALAIGFANATGVPDPTTDPKNGASWALPALTCTGLQSVRLDFQGLAGFRLGEQTSSARLIVGATSSAATGQAPVTVTQNSEPDDSSATAPAIQPNTLAIGHIATSGDLDWRSLSTTGMVKGTKILVYLRPPSGTDLDVYLTKPASQTLLSSPIPNSPIPNSPIPNSPLPDNSNALNTTSDNPQPEGLQDAPIPNSDIAAAGITRGDGVEVAQVVLGGDENGPVKIVVDGYNGDHSADAYTLRVKVITPPQLPACSARTYAFSSVTNQGTLPASIPAGTQNLFIMNFGATAKTYGLAAANNLLTKLNSVAGRADVNGAVLQVDGDAAVRTAKAAWDASPCSIAAANDVVRKVNAVVARYRAQATGVQSLTIVGGTELMPMASITDLTTDANESSAVGDLLFTTNGFTRANALFASEFLGNTLTDDAYTAGTTIPWFGRELYLPQIAGGRLVETPTEIMGQLQQYIDSNGQLLPSTAAVSGYDFMQDEATQISADIGARSTPAVSVDASNPLSTSPLPLIGNDWAAGDIQGYYQIPQLQRGVVSANGHYNHWELAPAQPSPPTSTNLVSSNVLPVLGSTTLQDKGSILFTMGCHAGLNVSDTFPSGTTPERLRDWAQGLSQNRVAVYIANTGYGYGDFGTIALSERLMTLLSANLRSDGPIGKKLVLAKQTYFKSIASYDPYAEKALAEATFYGLPFYRLGTGAEPPAPTPVPTVTDPLGTPNVRAATFTFDPALTRHHTDRGDFWAPTADAAGVEYLKDRPIEPRLSTDATAAGTLRAHGVRITELSTGDVPGDVDPLIASPMIDLASHEPENRVANITFPATFATVNHTSAFGAPSDTLVVVPGQTRRSATGGETQRLVSHIKLDVLYSTSTDLTAPTFTQVGSIVNGSTATLFARTNDGTGTGVTRVVAFFTQGQDAWRFETLTRVGTSDLYTKTVTGITVPRLEAAFSSQDGAGNVGYTTDKGTLFTSLSGDSQPPQVIIASPIDNATYTLGQSVSASFTCSDDGGVSTCTGTTANGVNIDTSTLGQKSFVVSATDISGNRVTVTANYTVDYKFGGFLSPIHNPPDFNMVNPGSSVPIKFTLNGNQGLSIFATGSPASQPVTCDPTAPLDTVTGTMTSGGSSLGYDSKTGIYTYSWKTDSSWRGCRQLIVMLRDGTRHVANFRFS